MAPVMSSVTCAFTVRSPSARSPISLSSRRIASWFFLFSVSACAALRRRIGEEHEAHDARARRRASAREDEHGDERRHGLLAPAARPGAAAPRSAAARTPPRAARPPAAPRRASAARAGSGLTFFSNASNCFLSSASFARASASRTGTIAERLAAGLERLDEVAQVVGVLPDEERHFRIDRLGAEDLRRAAAETLGEEREAIGAQHLRRAGSPTGS